ncbi:MAG: choice-of-anchor J domain-containing protein, partial [Flavobacterium sp.]|nr:choice-of-anchor J domain-containing protein [Flavobacterium sp.]
MKKILLSLALIVSFGTLNAQNIYNYGFSGTTANLTTAGWVRTNQSTVTPPTAASTTLWTVSSYAAVTVSATQTNLPFGNTVLPTGSTCPPPNGQAGGANSFALVNYTSTSSTLATGATISNWLISPMITVNNGDVVTFYSRRGKIPGSAGAGFADRMQLRISTDGAFSVDPSTGPTDTGSYSIVAADINPALAAAGYPDVWTQYSYTMTGLTGPTASKFAFRYFVTDGGTNGPNSDIIGIDTFSVDTPEACAPPTNLIASATTTTGSTISWTAPTTAPANGYEYYYSTTNTAPIATTVATGTTAAGITTKVLTGLTTGSTYYFWVRSVCSGTTKSSWS